MGYRRIDREFYVGLSTINILVLLVLMVLLAPSPEPVLAQSPPVTRQLSHKTQKPPAVVGTPVKIEVPDLGVDLTVAIGTYSEATGEWTLNDSQAFYADMSMPINDVNGTTLIYAHATSNLFAPLAGLRPGMNIYVTTNTSRLFLYQYTSLDVVSPEDTTVFTADGPPTLVLQTCSGAWDAYRTLYRFGFVDERAI